MTSLESILSEHQTGVAVDKNRGLCIAHPVMMNTPYWLETDSLLAPFVPWRIISLASCDYMTIVVDSDNDLEVNGIFLSALSIRSCQFM